MRGQQFFLHAADGEHFSTQRDFAGHGDVATDRRPRKRAYDRRSDGNPGRWAILGDGSFGNVDVNINMAVEIAWQSKRGRAGAYITHGCLGGFLHNVTELSGKRQAALP